MSARPILVFGAGGHGKVLVDALLASGETIAGLLDADPARHGTTVLGLPVLGGDDVAVDYPPASVRVVNGIGSNRRIDRKRALYERLAALGHEFAAVRHPTSVVGRDALLGSGIQLLARAVVESGARIGDDVTVNTAAVINHDCRIGSHVHVAPGALVLGAVSVGAATLVGAGAVILPGLRIGEACVIGAGAVVTADVPDRTTVCGVPARDTKESWKNTA